MFGFADEAIIEIHSGKGGNGCISFRREKYVPKGGPNGGDGGKGGDVIMSVKRNMRTLSKHRHHRIYKAKNGGDGQGWNKFGKDGDDVVINVPPGTTVRDFETGELIHDFNSEAGEDSVILLEGGNGGWGNVHFKSSTNQAPRYAYSGKSGSVKTLKLELSIMADVGLVGFPNAGKSSLLTAFTNARPKIAPYPFTTKIPNLGVLRVDDEQDIIIADIPGIIEGASDGAGLGFDFLKHISRTSCLLFMIDCSDETEKSNCFTAYKTLCSELENYNPDLMDKPRIVLCNKIDVEKADINAFKIIDEIRKKEPQTSVIPISIQNGTGMGAAKKAVIQLVNGLENHSDDKFLSKEICSSFLNSRSVDENMETQYPGEES